MECLVPMSKAQEVTPKLTTSCKDKEKLSFEERLAKLEEIVETLEEGRLGLSKSLELFEEAVMLAKSCRTELTDAELKISQLTGRAEPEDRLALEKVDDEAE